MNALGYIKESAIQGSKFGSTFDLSPEGKRWLRKAKQAPEEKLLATPNGEILHEEKQTTPVKITLDIKQTGPRYVLSSYLK